MAKINFYLKASLADERLANLKKEDKNKWEKYLAKPLPLIMYISLNGRRIQQPMGVSIPPKFWDSRTRRVKILSNLPEHLKELNSKLNTEESRFLSDKNPEISYRKSRTKEGPFLLRMNQVKNGSNEFKLPSFEIAMATFLKEHKNYDGFDLCSSTINKYQVLKRHFLTFMKTYRIQYDWDKFDVEELKLFQMYLYDVVKITDNTASKYIKSLKSFYRFWKEKGLKIDEKLLGFKTREYAATVIVLELGELEKLRTFEPKDPNLKAIQDVFLFMCWTGQRYSDISRIEWKDISTINGAPVWMVTTQKTRDSSITIPLNEIALSIIEKYSNSAYPIPRIPDQYFNRSLKFLAKELELNRPIRTVKRTKGIPVQNSKPLHELLTSHIGRKTFITNSLILGLSESEVKKFSGHKDDRSFRRYVELGDSIINSGKRKLGLENILRMTNGM